MQIIVKLFQNGPFEAGRCTPPTSPSLINTTKWKRDQQEISLNPELWSENIKTASSLWQHFKTIENQNDFSRKLQQRISNSTFHTSNKIYYLESGSFLRGKYLCAFLSQVTPHTSKVTITKDTRARLTQRVRFMGLFLTCTLQAA